jgi:hypothetical membrane protein
VGPAVFITTWAALGATAEGYDPTRTAISRLAAIGAPTRPAMTGGLVVLAGGMGLYAAAIRRRPAWVLAAANGLATLAVAALPLGSTHDTAHGVSAGLGYVTLAAIPLLSAPALHGRARRAAAVAAGTVSGLCLLATTVVDRDGLLQRVGLTVAQLWVVASALSLVVDPAGSTSTPGGAAGGARSHR